MPCSLDSNQHFGYLIETQNIYIHINYHMAAFERECLRKLQPTTPLYRRWLNSPINDLLGIIHLDLNSGLELLIKGNSHKNTWIIYWNLVRAEKVAAILILYIH